MKGKDARPLHLRVGSPAKIGSWETLAAICNNIGEFLGTCNQQKITKATSRHHFQNSTSRYRRQYRLGSLSGCKYWYRGTGSTTSHKTPLKATRLLRGQVRRLPGLHSSRNHGVKRQPANSQVPPTRVQNCGMSMYVFEIESGFLVNPSPVPCCMPPCLSHSQ